MTKTLATQTMVRDPNVVGLWWSAAEKTTKRPSAEISGEVAPMMPRGVEGMRKAL